MRTLWLAFTMMLGLAVPAYAEPPVAPTVYRGPGSGPLPKLAAPERAASTVAGKTLWTIADDGTVTGCRLESTFNVGQRVVMCAQRHRKPGS
jgi:hypothetical protein